MKCLLGNFINSIKKKDIFLFALLFLMIGYIIGLKAIISSDYVPINGAFQNYNVWRRNIEGQLPYKDFTVYLGV